MFQWQLSKGSFIYHYSVKQYQYLKYHEGKIRMVMLPDFIDFGSTPAYNTSYEVIRDGHFMCLWITGCIGCIRSWKRLRDLTHHWKTNKYKRKLESFLQLQFKW